MKLLKTESPYLDKQQWRKLFLAMSIMTLVLYIVAMIFSLCGSKYFILNYQNEQMDRIEAFMTERGIQSLISWAFTTFEFFIILSFVLKKFPSWYYILAFYGIRVILAFIVKLPSVFNTIYPILFYWAIPFIEQLKTKEYNFKKYLFCELKLLIAMLVVFTLQVIIYVIKTGEFTLNSNVPMPLASNFIYALEYDIALSIVLNTITLFFDKEKGDSNSWMTYHTAGSSSQTLKTKSQRSNLTKTQKNKLKLLYLKFYLIQLSSFLLLMILPFLLGKVFEFLVMYLAFAITRYILGFKYSLHYKKEVLCITVGIIVFGILALTVPFFYVVVIIAILLGVSLAILLHLSYKYKGFYMFNKIARPDKFAELYVIMDGDLTPHHVEIMCRHKGLDKEQTEFMLYFAEGNKKSYIAKKYNYSEKTIDRKLDELLEILNKNS